MLPDKDVIREILENPIHKMKGVRALFRSKNIGDFKEMDPADIDGNGVPDIKEMEGIKLDYDIEPPDLPEVPKKKFKNTAFGKTIYTLIGIAAPAAAAEISGVPVVDFLANLTQIKSTSTMDFFADMSLLQIIIIGIAFVITTVVPVVFPAAKNSAVYKTISKKIDPLAAEIRAAVDKESEGGRKITKNELKGIIAEVFARDNE